MNTQGIMFDIYVESVDDGNAIIDEFDGCDFYDENLFNCYASWDDDEEDAILVSAQVPDRWNENRATRAMANALDDLGLNYDGVEAFLE